MSLILSRRSPGSDGGRVSDVAADRSRGLLLVRSGTLLGIYVATLVRSTCLVVKNKILGVVSVCAEEAHVEFATLNSMQFEGEK